MIPGGVKNQASTSLTRPLVMAVDGHQLPNKNVNNDGAIVQTKNQMPIITLPDLSMPEKDSGRQYILIQGRIFELVSLTIHKKQLHGSYFVGTQVISDGRNFYVASHLDPLFFILHYCSSRSESFECSYEPLDQWWHSYDIPIAIQKATCEAQLQHICDISNFPSWEDGKEDQKVYKFNAKKAAKWLVKKYNRTVDILKKKELQKANDIMKHSHKAKSVNFNLLDEEENTGDEPTLSCSNITSLSPRQERVVRVSALQAVCEYLSKEWRQTLVDDIKCNNFDISFEEITAINEKKNSSADSYGTSKKRLNEEVHQSERQEDIMQAYTMGTTNDDALYSHNKKTCKTPKSAAVKRLAKVNTKGMKSLTSFFGAVKKQKR